MVKKATSVKISGLVLLLRYRSFAAKEWNLFASSVESAGDSLTLKRLSPAGVVESLHEVYHESWITECVAEAAVGSLDRS